MIERLRRQLEDLGTAFSLNTLGFVVGAMEIWAGRPDLAEREARSNCEALMAMGERASFSSLACFLADARYRQGDLDEAEDWVGQALQAASPEDLEAQSDARLIRAKVLAARGAFQDAETLAREGLAIAQRTDEIDHVGRRLGGSGRGPAPRWAGRSPGRRHRSLRLVRAEGPTPRRPP